MEWTTASPGSAPNDRAIEIVANLWYVIDEQGFIFSLRVKPYAVDGTEEEKLSFLTSRAYLDYLVAKPFSIPHRYGTSFVSQDGSSTKYAVIHHDSTGAIGGIDQLFFDAIDHVQEDLPAQTRLRIPESPLIKVTALHGGKDGNILPIDMLPK